MKPKFVSAAPWRAALFALVLGAGVTTSQTAMAQANARPPERMTYQGYLVDGNGAVLGNSGPKNYDVIFRVWSSESGSSNPERLWSEQQTVTVDKGYFSVLLGEGTAVPGEARPALPTLFKGATASDRWVGITVKGIGAGGANVDILPRMRLLSSPYAFLAEQAVKLVRDDNSNDLLASSGNVLNLNGHLDLLGASSIEFGADVAPKEVNNGRIGYQLYSSGLDIVGAGTNVASRRITFHAQGGSWFYGPVSAPSFDGTHLGDGSSLTGVAKLGANNFTGDQTVDGHIRLGLVQQQNTVGPAGYGKAIVFSGGPDMNGISGFNNDNSDPLWIARYNVADNQSELRVVIGDDPHNADDKLVIGTMVGGNFTQAGTWAPKVSISANGVLEFRPDLAKEASAGKIGYETFTAGALDIVGAGTTGSNRRVKIWSEGGTEIGGTLRVTGFALWSANVEAYMNTLGAFDYPNLPLGVNNGIVADNGIRAAIFTVASDRRIKNAVGQSDGKADLATLRKIEITDYKYRDVLNHGAKTHKKVIAQQVEAVYPQAVSASTGVLPDIYKKATSVDGWIQLDADLKTGDRVRVVSSKADQIHNVVAVSKAKPGSTEEPKFQLEPPVAEGAVFVYGREVNDFRSVDYEAIAMLNVSATQELARRLEQKEAELAALRAELAQARGEKESLADNLAAMDARLIRLEKILKQQAALGPEKSGAELVQVRN